MFFEIRAEKGGKRPAVSTRGYRKVRENRVTFGFELALYQHLRVLRTVCPEQNGTLFSLFTLKRWREQWDSRIVQID